MVAFAAVLWAIVVSQSVPASSANQPPPTGLIVGRVVDGSTNRPVAGVTVSLLGGPVAALGPARTMPRALTNGTGQFVFRKVPKGSYQLRATRSGYADASYGQRRPGSVGGSLPLDDGQRVGDAVITIWKQATISGTVVDEAGEPLVSVQVRAFQRRFVSGRPRVVPAGTATTDDRGVYRFSSLTPGDYLVAFLWREAAVPTSVADLANNPALMNDPKNADVMRERAMIGSSFSTPGSPYSVQVGGLMRDLSSSSPVPPAGTADGPIYIYPTQFYPGVPGAARARAITVGSGESRDSIDFALRPMKTSRVSGTVIGPDGPVSNTAVRLVPANDESLTEMETSATMTGPAGEFTLLGVPAGQYVIKVVRQPRAPPSTQNTPVMTQIQIGSSMIMSSSFGNPNAPPAPIPDDPTLSAEVTVGVNGADLTDVVVPLQRSARLTGRFEFDGSAQKPDALATMRIFVTVTRADGGTSGNPLTGTLPGHADGTGVFKTYGILPGKYLLRASAPEGWTFRSATSEGRDLADVPFDVRGADINDVVITFTDRPTKLTGVVRAPDGNLDSAALVVIFPSDASAADAAANPRRFRFTRTDRTGGYSFAGLPAGDYAVAAIREETTPEWQDPQVLEELGRSATQVRLAEGDTRVQDLKSAGGGR